MLRAVYIAFTLLQLAGPFMAGAQQCGGTGAKKRAVQEQEPFPDATNMDSLVITYDDGSISVRVNGSGLVQYQGTSGVLVEGQHTRRIESAEVQLLLDAFRQADFFSLCDDYTVSATDVGSTTTSIQMGGARKAITDNWVELPEALKNVQSAILKFSHSDQWTTGNQDTVSGLLDEMLSPVARRELLSDILPRAALYSDTSVVQRILASDVELERRGPYRATALQLAADRGLSDMVAVLLKAGANPHAVDEFGRGALIFGAGSGDSEVVRLLLGAGVKADESDEYGDTALMAASASGNPDSVRLLLAKGADVNAENSRRQTALLSGASGDNGFSILDMGRRHADIPEEVIHRDVVVRLLVEAGANVNAHGWFGETALFSLHEDAVQELIRHHADLEARNDYGETALVNTVSDSIAEVLIKAGADVNSQDNDGKTALIWSAEHNYVEKLKVLVNAPGIDLERRDKSGDTALMKANTAHNEECIHILLAAGATG
jgi:ankyrin repeat protein